MKKLKEHKGVAAVEFAIILPLLVLLIFGIIEFGLLLYNQQVITNASREGARYGILAKTPRPGVTAITSVVTNYTGNNLITFSNPNTPQLYPAPTPCTGTFGEQITVTVLYTYNFLVVPNIIPGLSPFHMKAVSVMKCE